MLSPSRQTSWLVPSYSSVLGTAFTAIPFPCIWGQLVHVGAVGVVVWCFVVVEKKELKSNLDSSHFKLPVTAIAMYLIIYQN